LIIARKITSKPIIRKDFIINQKQIEESKYYGADAILLIAKILTRKNLTRLYNYSLDIGLDVLIEIENKNEIKKISDVNANLIGINNRNLREQKIDINKSIELAKVLKNTIIVSESGVNRKNINSIKKNSNISTFLIGGSILNQQNKVQYINSLYKS
jgi:indole-3-glycerol phosphate synthase